MLSPLISIGTTEIGLWQLNDRFKKTNDYNGSKWHYFLSVKRCFRKQNFLTIKSFRSNRKQIHWGDKIFRKTQWFICSYRHFYLWQQKIGICSRTLVEVRNFYLIMNTFNCDNQIICLLLLNGNNFGCHNQLRLAWNCFLLFTNY